MHDEPDNSIDAAQRILDLIDAGISAEALRHAVARATDVYILRTNLGVIEDLVGLGEAGDGAGSFVAPEQYRKK